jgi:hypothetical protein
MFGEEPAMELLVFVGEESAVESLACVREESAVVPEALFYFPYFCFWKTF